MTSVLAVRSLQSLHKGYLNSFSLYATPLTVWASTCPPRRLCATKQNDSDSEPEVVPENASLLKRLACLGPENESLLKRLTCLGVDVKMVRQRLPAVLRKDDTNEEGLVSFLQSKGASGKLVADIICRYPRAITRSREHLDQQWELWRNIFKNDDEIISILNRSPASFFRSGDANKLEKNILFLSSLGLNAKALHSLLTRAPRTFSNSVELNSQMVDCLEDVCATLGGKDPEGFAKAVITRNVYILIRSVRRVKANVHFFKDSLKFSDPELLAFLQGPGGSILDLSNDYLKKNLKKLEERLWSEGCQTTDIKKLVERYPSVLYIGPDTLSRKLDCLLKGGITVQQVLEKPKVLDYRTESLTDRLDKLHRVGYDFQKDGIAVLDTSRKRFDAKMERLDHRLPPKK